MKIGGKQERIVLIYNQIGYEIVLNTNSWDRPEA